MANDMNIKFSQRSAARQTQTIEIKLTPFDQRHYLKLIYARGETISRVVDALKPALALASALDAGCGVGFFSKLLADCGLRVRAFDGREANIVEARRRFPELLFEQADVQERTILQLGKFDLVLCFGLLYHLESPMAGIRNLGGMTEKCLLIESMCVPDERPAMFLREEPRADDQSLTDLAYYPSESSVVKMLYRAGFAVVYRITPLPDHEDFRETPECRRRRTVLLASHVPVDLAGFRLLPEPREKQDPWSKDAAVPSTWSGRIRRFVASPTRRKYLTLAYRMRRVFPDMPIPLRLPFGAWWLAEKGELDEKLMHSGFEDTERRFVEKLLRPGMTMLDAGAHHGLYTLLAAKRVGRAGRVIAFEPSPREHRRLEKHVRVNRCRNVHMEQCALAKMNGVTDFFVVESYHDWGNSLRPPAVAAPVNRVRVQMRRLDDVLEGLGVSQVDFIKLDVEGAELEFLEGAPRLLKRDYRPAILAEVQDIRTVPWGYAAKEIIAFLVHRNYYWFALAPDSSLRAVSTEMETYDANLVALPRERLAEFQSFLAEPAKGYLGFRRKAHIKRDAGSGIELLLD
jgi:FkbM family methyltransferase